MATTIKEFKAMGINTDSEDFKTGFNYGKTTAPEKFKATVEFILAWAKMQRA